MHIFLLVIGPEAAATVPQAATVLTAFAEKHLTSPRTATFCSLDRRVATVSAVDGSPELGGANYFSADASGFALFAGRPVFWQDGETADGVTPLDAAVFRRPVGSWADRLDGRTTVVRYPGPHDTVEVWTDPAGTYGVYTARAGRLGLLSNSPGLLRSLVGGRPRPEVAAYLMYCGYSLTGEPLWDTLERLPCGRLHRFHSADSREALVLLPDLNAPESLIGRGSDPDRGARLLTESVRALTDWPGRPRVLGLSGGRDSRILFAAAAAGRVACELSTVVFADQDGYPRTDDVVVAERVAASRGRSLRIDRFDDADPCFAAPERMARLLFDTTGGTVMLHDVMALRRRDGSVTRPIVVTGSGGEFARARRGLTSGMTRNEMVATIMRRGASRLVRPALSAHGWAVVRQAVEEIVDAALDRGVTDSDVPDVYYIRQMSTWAADKEIPFGLQQDTVYPFLMRPMIPELLGPSAESRTLETLHLEMLQRLAPDLVDIRFERTKPHWPALDSPSRRWLERQRVVIGKGAGVARRRLRRCGTSERGIVARRALEPLRNLVSERIGASRDDPIWDVLDLARIEVMLAQDPAALDTATVQQLWRVGSVLSMATFAESDPGGPPLTAPWRT